MKRLYFVVAVDVDEDNPTFVHTMAKQERLERLAAADIQYVVNNFGYTGHVHVMPSDKCPNQCCPGGIHYTPRVGAVKEFLETTTISPLPKRDRILS